MKDQMTGDQYQIKFSVDKMFRLLDAGKLKAFCDVTINDALVIKGVRILEGKKGVFVAMPQEQGKDHKWYDQVVFRNVPLYLDFQQVVVEHYEAQKALR